MNILPHSSISDPAGSMAALVMAMAIASCWDGTPAQPEVRLIVAEAPGGGPGPKVQSTDPAGSPRDVTLDVSVFGSGFDAQSTVALELAGNPAADVTVNSTGFVSQSELVANVTIGGQAVEAFHDVAVTNGRGKKGVGIELFRIDDEFVAPPPGHSPIPNAAFRDGGDRVRSDGAGEYLALSSFATNGQFFLDVDEESGRDVCVDWPAAGPDATIHSAEDWNDFVAASGGQVALGSATCFYGLLHTVHHSEEGGMWAMDANPGTGIDDVQASGGKLVIREYDGPRKSWNWRLMFSDARVTETSPRNNGLCIRRNADGSWTLGTDPSIAAATEDPNACDHIDDTINLIRFVDGKRPKDRFFVHVASFRMPFRLTVTVP